MNKEVINELPTAVCLCTPAVHRSFKIHSCCAQQQVDLVADDPFKIIAAKLVAGLQMTDHRFYGRPATVPLPLRFADTFLRLRHINL
jgi:hypothetical protein